MRIIVTFSNEDFSRQIEYIFNLIFSILGVIYKIVPFSRITDEEINSDALLISYGREKVKTRAKYQIHIYASDFFGENYLKRQSIPKSSLDKWEDLPVIFSGNNQSEIQVDKVGSIIRTNIDIIASCFFMITRYEEFILGARDGLDRFPAKESLAYKEKFLDRPIVNDYIELFWGWINSFNLGFKRKNLWPKEKDFGVCLTHDIDVVQKYQFYRVFRKFFGLILKQKKLQKALSLLFDYLKLLLRIEYNDPYWTFDYILEIEKKYNFKSSFYFIASKKPTKVNSDYSITDGKILTLIKQIEKEGSEVGLHPSFKSFDNHKIMKIEKERLNKIVSNKSYGVRQHCLRYKIPDTWKIQEGLGFLYDSTLGFADYEGFRCGICLPYKPFDLIKNKEIDIWELPLIIMDVTLYRHSYRNLSPLESFMVIKKYVRIVRKYNGLLVLLLHNSSLDEIELPNWRNFYEKSIEYIGGYNAFKKSGREIIHWWEKRT